MQVTAYTAFVAMYQALDAAYDTIKSESLRQYLSDANPFLFEGEGSADPAVYVEFEQLFNETCGKSPSAVDALSAVRSYLGEQDADALVAAFDSVVTPECWEKVVNH